MTQYHVVWVTRYRRTILINGVDEYTKEIIKGFRKFFPDIYIDEIGIDKDHIHLHMIIPPKYAVSKVINAMKVNSSRILRKKYIGMKDAFGEQDFS